MCGFRTRTAISCVWMGSPPIRWNLRLKSARLHEITNSSRETDITELQKIHTDSFWCFLNTISEFYCFQKSKLWSKPVAKGQLMTKKLHFITFEWTMLRYGGSPKVLRGSPDPKVHIVTLKLFREKWWKKVSSINYIPFSLGEPWVSSCFLSIFLHLRKTWFLGTPKSFASGKIIS